MLLLQCVSELSVQKIVCKSKYTRDKVNPYASSQSQMFFVIYFVQMYSSQKSLHFNELTLTKMKAFTRDVGQL